MGKTAINNVLVFDGETVTGPKTVVIDGAFIQSDPTGAEVIDATGCTILPGFIDCHVHVASEDDLKSCMKYGVTTVFDLGAIPKQLFEKLKTVKGTTEYLSSGLAAFAPGSMHAKSYERRDKDMSLKGEAEVVDWVKARVSEGVDFIKVIGDEGGFDQPTLNKLASEAKANGKMSIVHATTVLDYQRGLTAGYDMLTHAPLDNEVDGKMIQQMVAQGTIVSSTLFMAKTTLENEMYARAMPKGAKLDNSLKNVRMMHGAGIPVLAGTDSNPFGMGVNYGHALHEEIALLVQAGMTPIEALKASTSSTAKYFNLKDRGRIAPGLKADLVLIEGNPTNDIADTKKVKKVWKDGVEFV